MKILDLALANFENPTFELGVKLKFMPKNTKIVIKKHF